ncbi:MAG: U32 family peptidase, partial [Rhodospirillaceae bacterium]|nr:U32 family peptidase [Rhodospirillaceae bacterium]
QTLTHTIGALMPELEELRGMGIENFRLWPQAIDMVAVAQIFRDVLEGRTETQEAWQNLAGIADFAPFSNGFYHGEEGVSLKR